MPETSVHVKHKRLAQKLANCAHHLQEEILAHLPQPIHQQYNQFLGTLEHSQFAECFAQFICYAILSARLQEQSRLKLGTLLLGFPQLPHKAAINKLFRNSLRWLHEIQQSTVLPKLLSIVNNIDTTEYFSTKDEPILHFFETFLHHYQASERRQKGVYYTPISVVQSMVHGVHSSLQESYNLPLGLADTSLRGDVANWLQDSNISADTDQPFVQILDPAAGTGTFLLHTINCIRTTMLQQWRKESNRQKQILWLRYLTGESTQPGLLHRIFALEIMAPVVLIAHLRLTLNLYNHPDIPLLNLCSTTPLPKLQLHWGNSLSKPSFTKQRLTVVIGNPPYKGESKNQSQWIQQLLHDYKQEPQSNTKLKERNPKWLNDDYVKFFRCAQFYLHHAQAGILSYITPHGYLDNPTFRGMRWCFLQQFTQIKVLDLHGNSKRQETAPDGSKDENVFAIMQGVAITTCISTNQSTALAKTYQADLYGRKNIKIKSLTNQSLDHFSYTNYTPSPPFFLFKSKQPTNAAQYYRGFSIADLFNVYSLAIQTHRDAFVIDRCKHRLSTRIKDFYNQQITVQELRNRYQLKETTYWKLAERRKGAFDPQNIMPIDYRPFDKRWIYNHRDLIDRPRNAVMQHLLQENIALQVSKQLSLPGFQHAFVSSSLQEACLISNKTKEGGYTFPLYLYDGNTQQLNLSSDITALLATKIQLPFVRSPTPQGFHEVDVLDYVYAMLYSPRYRETYESFLQTTFPIIPYPIDRHHFYQIVTVGRSLRSCHLLWSQQPISKLHRFQGSGNDRIEKTFRGKNKAFQLNSSENTGKVFINNQQYFDQISLSSWQLTIGSYQVARKWLQERKKENNAYLSMQDQELFQSLVIALNRTHTLQTKLQNITLG